MVVQADTDSSSTALGALETAAGHTEMGSEVAGAVAHSAVEPMGIKGAEVARKKVCLVAEGPHFSSAQ